MSGPSPSTNLSQRLEGGIGLSATGNLSDDALLSPSSGSRQPAPFWAATARTRCWPRSYQHHRRPVCPGEVRLAAATRKRLSSETLKRTREEIQQK